MRVNYNSWMGISVPRLQDKIQSFIHIFPYLLTYLLDLVWMPDTMLNGFVGTCGSREVDTGSLDTALGCSGTH